MGSNPCIWRQGFLSFFIFGCFGSSLVQEGEWGLLFVAVRGLLIAVASLCGRARALGSRALEHRLSNCGTRA